MEENKKDSGVEVFTLNPSTISFMVEAGALFVCFVVLKYNI